jgi:DNA invertase Pin-like site-specific DNA recombinase
MLSWLPLPIYGYFAEAEREFVSMRVKQGLVAVKAKGIKLGRPKGSRSKERVLDAHRDENSKYLRPGIDLASVRKLINPELEQPMSHDSYKYFVEQDPE